MGDLYSWFVARMLYYLGQGPSDVHAFSEMPSINNMWYDILHVENSHLTAVLHQMDPFEENLPYIDLSDGILDIEKMR